MFVLSFLCIWTMFIVKGLRGCFFVQNNFIAKYVDYCFVLLLHFAIFAL